jgi:hypothetical protein
MTRLCSATFTEGQRKWHFRNVSSTYRNSDQFRIIKRCATVPALADSVACQAANSAQ